MSSYQLGQIVYIIIRNPHAQDVANVQQAAVVQNPDNPEQLSLFIYETYYPLTEEVAVYSLRRKQNLPIKMHLDIRDGGLLWLSPLFRSLFMLSQVPWNIHLEKS